MFSSNLIKSTTNDDRRRLSWCLQYFNPNNLDVDRAPKKIPNNPNTSKLAYTKNHHRCDALVIVKYRALRDAIFQSFLMTSNIVTFKLNRLHFHTR